ncbi:MAG: TetR family transcriptional regulator [Acidimicrobiales bacterium]|nr:MAG: TetR family transcriptional regulator [Acidimicrobiales bacterium]
MSDRTPRVGEQRPGGRAERVRTAVLEAAAELLTEVGYEKMSVEDVAARAGVHKTTVYRRWPTKAELTADAAQLHSADAVPIPDSGSVVGDLQLLAREVVANIGTEGGSRRSRSIAAAAATSEELATAMHGFWAHRLALSAVIVERAIRRGELAPTTDANLIIETVIGPLWLRLLLTGEPITEDLADEVVRLVTTGMFAD